MGKSLRNLRFTEEEITGIKQDKPAVETVRTKDGVKAKKEMKTKKRLGFEENKPKLSRKLRAGDIPAAERLTEGIRRKTEKDSENNASVQAVSEGTRQTERTVRAVKTRDRRKNRKASDKSERSAKPGERTVLRKEQKNSGITPEEKHASYTEKHSVYASNPYSRWRQKQEIKRGYYAAKRGETSSVFSSFSGSLKDSVKKTAKETGSRIAQRVSGNRTVVLVALGAVIALIIGTGVLSSMGTVLLQSTTGGVSISTYLSEDKDMKDAEKAYCILEADLQSAIDCYESTHGYDEYHIDLDPIGHDPYVLTSLLSAKHDGEYRAEDVGPDLREAFGMQYSLTQRVVKETRYRYELEYRYVTAVDAEGNTYQTVEPYHVPVPYDYYICYVTLRNSDLSHVPSRMLSEDQLSMYSIYMSTLGNREDLFPGSEYIGRYGGETEHYDIPEEYLENGRFAAMMAEADKYVGYPYVFGGSSPSTSFDCSGYVSWVINHSGWNEGRLTATQLYNICTPVSKGAAAPGDLIFFAGTYNSGTLCSHVGIIVDPVNRIMVNAGDPVQYESYDTDYWNSHYCSCGRLPEP